jgi:hypothetical protein
MGAGAWGWLPFLLAAGSVVAAGFFVAVGIRVCVFLGRKSADFAGKFYFTRLRAVQRQNLLTVPLLA